MKATTALSLFSDIPAGLDRALADLDAALADIGDDPAHQGAVARLRQSRLHLLAARQQAERKLWVLQMAARTIGSL